MGAAVELFQPHEVSGTLVSLLRELLGDVYADVRLAALQQVMPIGKWGEHEWGEQECQQQQLSGTIGVLCLMELQTELHMATVQLAAPQQVMPI